MKQNFKLTKDQQTLVEKNLSIVHWVIVNNIHVNPGICGLEYGDLFQEGCLWLCIGCAMRSAKSRQSIKNKAKSPIWPAPYRAFSRFYSHVFHTSGQ